MTSLQDRQKKLGKRVGVMLGALGLAPALFKAIGWASLLIIGGILAATIISLVKILKKK